MSTKHRWVCPECGSGVLAGKAPRTNATVRYCLPCSAKSDTLVERTCPALDRKRETSEERRREQAKRKREAEARRREAIAQRVARGKAARAAKRLDTRWSTDAPEHIRAEMETLSKRFPADVICEGGVLYLRLSHTKWKFEQRTQAPHSRSEMAVLLDYAASIGHPDADEMMVEFKRLGGMLGAVRG